MPDGATVGAQKLTGGSMPGKVITLHASRRPTSPMAPIPPMQSPE